MAQAGAKVSLISRDLDKIETAAQSIRDEGGTAMGLSRVTTLNGLKPIGHLDMQ